MRVIVRTQHFKGATPDIPFYPDVSVVAPQMDDDPFYVSLSLDVSLAQYQQMTAGSSNIGNPWVGHIESDGKLWVKTYIQPGQLREKLRQLKRRGGCLKFQITISSDKKLDLTLIPPGAN